MPSKSPAQHRLMEAAAHTKGGYGGVPQNTSWTNRPSTLTWILLVLRGCNGLSRARVSCVRGWNGRSSLNERQSTGQRITGRTSFYCRVVLAPAQSSRESFQQVQPRYPERTPAAVGCGSGALR